MVSGRPVAAATEEAGDGLEEGVVGGGGGRRCAGRKGAGWTGTGARGRASAGDGVDGGAGRGRGEMRGVGERVERERRWGRPCGVNGPRLCRLPTDGKETFAVCRQMAKPGPLVRPRGDPQWAPLGLCRLLFLSLPSAFWKADGI